MSASAFAASVNMEIFYLPHRPAVAVVEKIEQALSGMDYVHIKKYNFDDEATDKLVDKYKLYDHMPVAVFINGKDRYMVDGRETEFRNFPKGDAFVPTMEGKWSYEDLKKVAESLHGEK